MPPAPLKLSAVGPVATAAQFEPRIARPLLKPRCQKVMRATLPARALVGSPHSSRVAICGQCTPLLQELRPCPSPIPPPALMPEPSRFEVKFMQASSGPFEQCQPPALPLYRPGTSKPRGRKAGVTAVHKMTSLCCHVCSCTSSILLPCSSVLVPECRAACVVGDVLLHFMSLRVPCVRASHNVAQPSQLRSQDAKRISGVELMLSACLVLEKFAQPMVQFSACQGEARCIRLGGRGFADDWPDDGLSPKSKLLRSSSSPPTGLQAQTLQACVRSGWKAWPRRGTPQANARSASNVII